MKKWNKRKILSRKIRKRRLKQIARNNRGLLKLERKEMILMAGLKVIHLLRKKGRTSFWKKKKRKAIRKRKRKYFIKRKWTKFQKRLERKKLYSKLWKRK